MKTFWSDIRNVGGRETITESMLIHNWRLKNVKSTIPKPDLVPTKPLAKKQNRKPRQEARPPARPQSKIDFVREPQSTTSIPIAKRPHTLNSSRTPTRCEATATTSPYLAERLSRNKKCHKDLVEKEHKINLVHMHRRIQSYDPVLDEFQNREAELRGENASGRTSTMYESRGTPRGSFGTPTTARSPIPSKYSSSALVSKYYFESSDGFSLPKRMAMRIDRKTKECQDNLDIPTILHHDSFDRMDNPVKAIPEKRFGSLINSNSSLDEMIGVLGEYLRKKQMTVLDFFGTSSEGGDGSIPAYQLRMLLYKTPLNFTQSQITRIIKTVDSEEDGMISPISIENVLRRARHNLQIEFAIPCPNRIANNIPGLDQMGKQSSQLVQSYKSPRGANERPFSAPDQHMKFVREQEKDHFIQKRLLDAEQDPKKGFEVSDLENMELLLRKNLIRVIVKKRLYRKQDLEDFFEQVQRNTGKGREESVRRAIRSIRLELDL